MQNLKALTLRAKKTPMYRFYPTSSVYMHTDHNNRHFMHVKVIEKKEEENEEGTYIKFKKSSTCTIWKNVSQ